MSDDNTALGSGLMVHLHEARAVLYPEKGSEHGPLPPLLLVLTVVTGLVDAFSYLTLGHVLVANMTGNVVFFAFAVGGQPGFLWWASVLAIAAFLLGAIGGGRLHLASGPHRGVHLFRSALVEAGLVLASLIVALANTGAQSNGIRALLITLLGLALGLQNSTARALAVPDLTTTVLTLTITGIAADSHAAGGPNSKLGRRLVPIVAMFLGALMGAVLVVHDHPTIVLAVASALLVAVVLLALRPRRSQESWALRQ